MNNWLGPFKTADDAIDALRRSVAEIIGADPDTWPDHKNAPLAISAVVGLREGAIKQLRKERDALRTALDALRGKAIDRSVDNAFARFAGVFGKGPDAPYPGMIEAFENHYGQDFRDKDWRKEAACWAASWHRAVHRPAPASVPEGWLRAIDEALVVTHLGVANESDTYEQAREKLNNLIGWHVDIATDPAVNGGWKLVPIEPTSEMLGAGEDTFVPTYTGTPVSAPIDVYRAMLAAAPKLEVKK